MTGTVYSVTDSPRTVNKMLLAGITMSVVQPITEVDIVHPTLILDYSGHDLNFNYIEIQTFGRYYFIESKVVLSGNRVIVKCTVDVLMTYRNNIYGSIQTVVRNEEIGVNMEVDTKLDFYPEKENIFYISTFIDLFSSNFRNDTLCFVVHTNNGGTEEEETQ